MHSMFLVRLVYDVSAHVPDEIKRSCWSVRLHVVQTSYTQRRTTKHFRKPYPVCGKFKVNSVPKLEECCIYVRRSLL
jgi:hypothetical protein